MTQRKPHNKLLLLLLLSTATLTTLTNNYTSKKDPLGRPYKELIEKTTNTIHHIIDASLKHNPTKMIEHLYKHHEKNPAKVKTTKIIQCQPGHPDFFKFVSKTVAKLTGEDQKVENPSFCFKKVRFYFVKDAFNELTLFISSWGKKDLLCSDSYLVTSGSGFHMATIELPGVHKISFKNLYPDDVEFVKLNGLQIFRFCDSILNFVPNLLLTVSMFLGGLGDNPDIPFFGSHVPMYMQKMNVEFIKHATGYQYLPRDPPAFLDYPAENFRSGDFLAVIRFDGVDNIIQYGAGSFSGHSVMALWDRSGDKPQLYIVESQDGWYWPQHGLQKTKWEQWRIWAKNADFNLAHMRLRDEYQKKFDEEKAWAWFKQTEGMPYGYRNFLFGWIDTPKSNLPPVLDIEFIFTIFKFLEGMGITAADRLIKEALNWRVGLKGKSLKEVQQTIMRNNMKLEDVFAIPEKDKFRYSDGYSYVCSSYVMSFYLESGMMGDLKVQATEFTPKDIYMLDVFEKDGDWRTDECKKLNPESAHCQFSGHWNMTFPGYSSVKPYDKMNEKCPSLPPLYVRPEGC